MLWAGPASRPKTCSRAVSQSFSGPSLTKLALQADSTTGGAVSPGTRWNCRLARMTRVGRIDRVSQPSVAFVTLGCARNEVDSEELAGRLAADGFRLVDDPAAADTVLVNTCGFVEQAKKDSVDALLEASDLKGTEHGPQVGGGGGLPGRTVRRGAGLVAARGRRGAGLRRLSGHRGAAAVDRGRGAAARRTPRRTGAGCCRSPPWDRQSDRTAAPVARTGGSRPARWRRSSSRPGATGAARSARSRRSAALS